MSEPSLHQYDIMALDDKFVSLALKNLQDVLARSGISPEALFTKYDFDGESFVNPVIMKTMEGSDKDHVGGVLTTGNNGEIYFVIGDQDEHTNVHVNMPDGPSPFVTSPTNFSNHS